METGLLDMDIPQVTSADSRETANSALALAFVSREASFMNYSRYEANLSRAYERTLKQLLAVRKERLDETKPIPVENKQPPPEPPAPEPNLRTELDPPADPKDATNRRHGRFIPFPEQSPRSAELIWICEPNNDDTNPHAPGPRVPRG